MHSSPQGDVPLCQVSIPRCVSYHVYVAKIRAYTCVHLSVCRCVRVLLFPVFHVYAVVRRTPSFTYTRSCRTPCSFMCTLLYVVLLVVRTRTSRTPSLSYP